MPDHVALPPAQRPARGAGGIHEDARPLHPRRPSAQARGFRDQARRMRPSKMGTTGVTYEHRATEVGITEADIRELIPAFYAKVRYDSILGPVFEGIIGDNWATHNRN